MCQRMWRPGRTRSWPAIAFAMTVAGRCPLDHCPNLRPAFEALREMGFTRLRVLVLPNNFGIDWVKKGYPVEK